MNGPTERLTGHPFDYLHRCGFSVTALPDGSFKVRGVGRMGAPDLLDLWVRLKC